MQYTLTLLFRLGLSEQIETRTFDSWEEAALVFEEEKHAMLSAFADEDPTEFGMIDSELLMFSGNPSLQLDYADYVELKLEKIVDVSMTEPVDE